MLPLIGTGQAAFDHAKLSADGAYDLGPVIAHEGWNPVRPMQMEFGGLERG
jgi:hypothetical protein